MKKIWENTDYSSSNLFQYESFLKDEFSLNFKNYDELHLWSTKNLSDFWLSIIRFFKIEFSKKFDFVLKKNIPFYKSIWFQGSELSYSHHILRNAKEGEIAIIYQSEVEEIKEITWNSLLKRIREIRKILINQNINKGDVVAGYLVNHPDTIASFIAVNSLGAIWTCCSPDFGVKSVIERFIQLKPKVLIAHDEYMYNGRIYNQKKKIEDLENKLESLKKTVTFSSDFKDWEFNTDFLIDFDPVNVEFSHPIWVLFSSGTTGKPKAITHSTGGILIEQYKSLYLHQDVKYKDRFFWNTTTGWMMWNYSIGSLLCGAIICIYDGSANFPDLSVQWRFAKQAKINHFGNGSPFYIASMKKNIKLGDILKLNNIKTLGATGSSLTEEAFIWTQKNIPNAQIISLSGGTDVCSAFIGGCSNLPVYAGFLQCKMLGASIEAWDKKGKSVVGQTGELVITEPLPSMPIFFWNDNMFEKYHESYFYKNVGVWTHGDWIHIHKFKGIIMQGRSDATLNRNGIRIGTSEIYSIIDKIEEVRDSIIIDINIKNSSKLVLFVSTTSKLNKDLKDKIIYLIKTNCSPRHIPNFIFSVSQIPYTISGKKMEIPIKKILSGKSIEKSISKGAMKNPECINEFLAIKNQYL